MSGQLSFIKEYETYCPQIKAYNDRNECMQIHVRFPIVMTDLSGSKKRIRYARVEKTEDGTQVAQARSEDRYGNQFEIVDVWSESKQGICIQRYLTVLGAAFTAGRTRSGVVNANSGDGGSGHYLGSCGRSSGDLQRSLNH